jgi:hypothetical protein
MKIVASSILTLSMGLFAWGQSPTRTKPNPPTLEEPGVQHPLPVPKQTPEPVPPNAKQKDVRHPVHETGRERAVSGGADRKSPDKNTTKKATKKDSGEAAPSSSKKPSSKSSSKPEAPAAKP